MIVEEILRDLPAEIVFDKIAFHLQIIHDYNELRLCYAIGYTLEGCPHEESISRYGCWNNPLYDDNEIHCCSFLYLVEGIQADGDLLVAIREVRRFLEKHNLLKNEIE